MDTEERPTEILDLFNEIYRLIDDGKLNEAKQKADKLKGELGEDDPELTGIDVTIELEMLDGES
jgi:hypothetical protein